MAATSLSVRMAAGLAGLGAAHACVNAGLLRRPRLAFCVQPVSVLIPARDEAGRIGGCVRSVLAQRGIITPELIVLDDSSRDDTATVAAAAGARVVTGPAAQPGQIGKPLACRHLAELASHDLLVFLDADVVLAPDALASAIDLLERVDVDFLSPYPRQVAVTRLERLVQPLLQWSWLTFVPLRWAETARWPSLAIANGQFLVVRRDAYLRAGGHPNEVLDDIALARALRRTGRRGGVVDGTHLAECRMYTDAASLSNGYEKSLWTAFGSPGGAIGVCLLLAVVYLVPAVAALRGSRAGLAGYAAGVLGRVVTAQRTGGRAWPDALAHPFSIGAMIVLTGRSLRGRRRGTLTWKGRPL